MNLAAAATSSVGRKIINALTGLFFVGFVIGHLTGNLLLFAGPDAFNSYAHFLESFFHGWALPVVELVMLAFIAMHAYTGISVWANKYRARKANYQVRGNAGGPSRKSLASQTMLWSGILLLFFLFVHILSFKFGVGDPRPNPEGGVNLQNVTVDGVTMTNLYGRVVDFFGMGAYTAFYVIVMIMLGAHLWHGTWSAFQSLGLANDRYLPILRKLGNVFAALLAVGFLALPVIIYGGNSYFQEVDQAYVQLHPPSAPDTQPSH